MNETGPEIAALEYGIRTMDTSVLSSLFEAADANVAFANDALLLLGALPLGVEEELSLRKAVGTGNGDRGLAIFRIALALAASREAGPSFKALGKDAARSGFKALFAKAMELGGCVESGHFIDDPEGREEIARTLVDRFGLLPAGETKAQADDRLRAVDSVERARVVEKSREARRRAEEIRRAIEAREAEEAASKMTRD